MKIEFEQSETTDQLIKFHDSATLSCVHKPRRERPQQLDPDGKADEGGHAAVGDGRGEEHGDGIGRVVHLQEK